MERPRTCGWCVEYIFDTWKLTPKHASAGCLVVWAFHLGPVKHSSMTQDNLY
jgi:hypothetical protein